MRNNGCPECDEGIHGYCSAPQLFWDTGSWCCCCFEVPQDLLANHEHAGGQWDEP